MPSLNAMAFNLCHCIYRWITLFVKRIQPSITVDARSRRAIITIIIIIIIIIIIKYCPIYYKYGAC